LLPLLAEQIDHSIASHPEQPGTGTLYRGREVIRLDELEKHVLQDVVSIGGIAHPAANEVAQPVSLTANGRRDFPVVLRHQTERLISSMRMKTFQTPEYCGERFKSRRPRSVWRAGDPARYAWANY